MRVRCPDCRSPMEVDSDSSFSSMRCAACGSQFNLISGEEEAPAGEVARNLGHFELLEAVGGGRFGTVWRARDTELDRIVALKIPRKDQLQPEEYEHFFREARAAAQLRHQNIVPVHETGRIDETAYIVSNLIDGPNLRDWLQNHSPGFRQSARLCASIADALQHAHEQGVVHRDIKPGNIVLDADGEPHITDFGLARRDSGEITLTMEGRLLGTPAYMSPEQARGEGHAADARSDVYSTGVVLFELLTGELPFQGQDRLLILRILNDPPPDPRRLKSKIPRDLAVICLKCLEKEASRRYQSAGELADDLTRWLEGRPVLARPVTRLENTWRMCRRNPAVAGLAALLVILLTCWGTTATLLMLNARERARVARQESLRADAATLRAVAQQERADEAATDARRLAANVALVQALDFCDRGHVQSGLLWLSRAVSLAPAEDENLQLVIRRNLTGWGDRWRETLPEEEPAPLRNIRQLPHEAAVCQVALTRDGRTAATADETGAVFLWQTDSDSAERHQLPHLHPARHLVFDAAGERLLTIDHQGDPRVWSVGTRQLIRQVPAPAGLVLDAVFFRDDVLLCCIDEAARPLLIRAPCRETGPKSPETVPLEATAGPVQRAAFNCTGDCLLTCDGHGIVRLWRTADGQQLGRALRHRERVHSSGLLPDGVTVLTSTASQPVRLWNGYSGKPLGAPLTDRFVIPSPASRWTPLIPYSSAPPDLPPGLSQTPEEAFSSLASQLVELLREGEIQTVELGEFADPLRTGTGGIIRGALQKQLRNEGLSFGSSPILISGQADLERDREQLVLVVTTTIHSTDAGTMQQIRQPIPLEGDIQNLFDTLDLSAGSLLQPQPLARLSEDGRLLLLNDSSSARLWHLGSRRPLGPPLQLDLDFDQASPPETQTSISRSNDGTGPLPAETEAHPPAVIAHHNGRILALFGVGRRAVLWTVPPPVSGTPEQLVLWTQTITGMELDGTGTLYPLDSATLQQRSQRLQKLGGWPLP